VLSQQVAEKGTVSHPFFAPTSFPPQEKQTTSFSDPLYLRRWLLLIPRFAMQPPFQKLSRFDEPTSPQVTMTESHTRCVSRGKSHPADMDVDVDSGNGADTERARHGDTPFHEN
jgi:hypothetical protein